MNSIFLKIHTRIQTQFKEHWQTNTCVCITQVKKQNITSVAPPASPVSNHYLVLTVPLLVYTGLLPMYVLLKQ